MKIEFNPACRVTSRHQMALESFLKIKVSEDYIITKKSFYTVYWLGGTKHKSRRSLCAALLDLALALYLDCSELLEATDSTGNYPLFIEA